MGNSKTPKAFKRKTRAYQSLLGPMLEAPRMLSNIEKHFLIGFRATNSNTNPTARPPALTEHQSKSKDATGSRTQEPLRSPGRPGRPHTPISDSKTKLLSMSLGFRKFNFSKHESRSLIHLATGARGKTADCEAMMGRTKLGRAFTGKGWVKPKQGKLI